MAHAIDEPNPVPNDLLSASLCYIYDEAQSEICNGFVASHTYYMAICHRMVTSDGNMARIFDRLVYPCNERLLGICNVSPLGPMHV